MDEKQIAEMFKQQQAQQTKLIEIIDKQANSIASLAAALEAAMSTEEVDDPGSDQVSL